MLTASAWVGFTLPCMIEEDSFSGISNSAAHLRSFGTASLHGDGSRFN
jgi:hypothetical protein